MWYFIFLLLEKNFIGIELYEFFKYEIYVIEKNMYWILF